MDEKKGRMFQKRARKRHRSGDEFRQPSLVIFPLVGRQGSSSTVGIPTSDKTHRLREERFDVSSYPVDPEADRLLKIALQSMHFRQAP
jgi:hypothetical protein